MTEQNSAAPGGMARGDTSGTGYDSSPSSIPPIGIKCKPLRTDTESIERFYNVMVEPGAVHEVRIVDSKQGGPCKLFGTVSGYFNDLESFTREVVRITGKDAAAVFMTLNPVDLDLLARADNHLKNKAKETTSDAQIVKRTHLLIDLDPSRASGISSTDEERDAALALRDKIRGFLRDLWQVEPAVITMSGNGAGLLYKIDLPNDDGAKQLVEACLKTLGDLFDAKDVQVDQTVGTAARLTKIVGTVAAKGDDVPALGRRWRVATGDFNFDAAVVPRDSLETLAAMLPPVETPTSGKTGKVMTVGARTWTVPDLLDKNGIGYQRSTRSYCIAYRLDRCLTSPDHNDGAVILEFPTGALAYRCAHNGCKARNVGWSDVRRLLGLNDTKPQSVGLAEQPDDSKSDEAWEPPTPFSQYNASAFPVEAFPDWLWEFVRAEAIATQTPIDLAAMMGLSGLSTALARKVEVNVRPGWREPVNIFTATALESGNRKSAVVRDICRPIEEYEKAETDSMAPKLAEALAQRKVSEQRLANLQAQAAKAKLEEAADLTREVGELAQELAASEVPAVPRLVVDDCTPEKLSTLLCNHGGRIAALSPEGDVFDLMAARYGNSPNFGVFLRGHSGDAIRVDRVGRKAEYVASPAITVGVAVQPEVIRGLADAPGFRGRGLLARFLYSWPTSTLGRRDPDADPVPDHIRAAYHGAMTDLLNLPFSADDQGSPAPHPVVFSPEAQSVFRNFEHWVEPQLGQFGDMANMTDWGGKLAGAVARIAGLLHGATHHDGPAPWARPIARTTVEAAIKIGHYLIAHARIAFSEMGTDERIADAQHVLAWIEKTGMPQFKKQDVWQSTKGRFKMVENLEPALELLEEYGYIREIPPEDRKGPGRKPAPVYEVNPLAFGNSRDNSNCRMTPGDVGIVDNPDSTTFQACIHTSIVTETTDAQRAGPGPTFPTNTRMPDTERPKPGDMVNIVDGEGQQWNTDPVGVLQIGETVDSSGETHWSCEIAFKNPDTGQNAWVPSEWCELVASAKLTIETQETPQTSLLDDLLTAAEKAAWPSLFIDGRGVHPSRSGWKNWAQSAGEPALVEAIRRLGEVAR